MNKIWIIYQHNGTKKRVAKSQSELISLLSGKYSTYTNIEEYVVSDMKEFNVDDYFKAYQKDEKDLTEDEKKSVEFVEKCKKNLKSERIIDKLEKIKYDYTKVKSYVSTNFREFFYTKIDHDWYVDILNFHNFKKYVEPTWYSQIYWEVKSNNPEAVEKSKSTFKAAKRAKKLSKIL